jgi:hypothetical protein
VIVGPEETHEVRSQVPPLAPFGTLPARLDLAAIIDRARAGPVAGAR